MMVLLKNKKTLKKLEVIIRTSTFEKVKASLFATGVSFFTFWDMKGVGKSKDSKLYRGSLYDDGQIERRMLSIVINDAYLEKTIQTILDSAATYEIGDGKIFISEIEDVVRIRNGERGPEAIYVKKR